MKVQEVTLRSDHLEAVINYCLEQTYAGGGDINPLAFGDNENAVGERTIDSDNETLFNDIRLALESMLTAVQAAKGDSHKDLFLLPLPDYFVPVAAIVDLDR